MCPHFHFRIPIGIIRMTKKSGEKKRGECLHRATKLANGSQEKGSFQVHHLG